MLDDGLFDPVYMAVVDCVEEAVVNAMLAAEDSGGTQYDRFKIEAIRTDKLLDIMGRYGRVESAP